MKHKHTVYVSKELSALAAASHFDTLTTLATPPRLLQGSDLRLLQMCRASPGSDPAVGSLLKKNTYSRP